MKRPFACMASLALFLLLLASSPRMVAQQGDPKKFPEQKTSSAPASPAVATSTAVAKDDKDADEDEGEDEGFSKKRDLWFIEQRAYPNEHLPAGARTRALQQHLALKGAATHSLFAVPSAKASGGFAPLDTFTSLSWSFDGPATISAGTGSTTYSGRATSLAINPVTPTIMYLGTAGGGVWKTTDGGKTWAAITDSQASLAIGAIAIDPNNPNNVYAGTGEADYSGDSYYGQGLLKSTDGGTTWTLISTPFVSGGSAQPFAQIAIQPGNSSVLVAATSSGLYRSTDAGMTWVNTLPSYASAVIFDPVNTSTVYAGMNGYYNSIVYGSVTAPIYKSTNGGVTWTAVTGVSGSALPAGSTVFRVALTLDSTGNLLAGVAPSSLSAGTPYKSSDGGTTWKALTSPGDGLDWYRDWIAAVPGSPNVLFAGGVSLFQSLDGGVTWTKSSYSYASLLWADQHAAVFSPDGTKMYLMDDGGIFMTSTPGTANAAFVSLNNNIGSMTFYPGFGVTGTNGVGTIVGAQDHGTQIGTGSLAWNYAGGGNVCGDGGQMAVDNAGIYAYAHCQGSPLSSWMSSATGGAVQGQGYPYGWVSAQTGITTADRTSFVPPVVTDPSNAPNVYTGTYRVYQSLNRGQLWTAISGDLTAGTAVLNTLAVAPGNPNVVYAGAGDGTVSVTVNALAGTGATWTKLSGLPNRSVSKIVVATDSPQDVYVTFSGFGSGHVWHSTTGGSAWTDISGNLPNTPTDSIAIDPTLLNTLYLATDTGVYVSSTGGTSWEVLGSNLPNVVVQDVQFIASTRVVRVVTHGRGAWDITVPVSGVSASVNQLTFAGQNVGTTSAAQMVTLTNNLGVPITVSSVSPTAGFGQTNTCGTSLASGAACQISVTFTPSATGALTGKLVVTTSQGTVTVTLTGTGTAPAVVLSATLLAFGSQVVGVASTPQAVTLQNTGTGALTGLAVTVTGANPGDFTSTNTCGSSVAAGASCGVTVVFTPGASGARSATLNLADNATGSPQTISLTGTGVTPMATLSLASLTFAAQPLGFASAAQTLTLNNTGNIALTGVAVTVSGANASDFAETTTCGATLATGASCTISVSFNPGALGSRGATLNVADSATGSPQTAALSGTGIPPFSLTGSVTSATVKQGSSATYALSLAAAAGTTTSSAVSLSCSGLPAASACAFTPASIAAGTGTQGITLVISTTAATAGLARPARPGRGFDGGLEALDCALLVLWLVPRRRWRHLAGLALVVFVLGGLSGCGKTTATATSTGTPGTPTGTYTVTVTAQSASYSAVQTVSLTVQ